MELFAKLFASLLVFVYHCFDRIVINGYLSGLSRPEQVVHFVREVLGIPVVSKEVLSKRTNDYRSWVEAFARNHKIPMEWAGKGVRKEEYVLPSLRRMGTGTPMASTSSSRAWSKADLSVQRAEVSHPGSQPPHSGASDEPLHALLFLPAGRTLGPMVMRVASFFPFQATYCLNGHSFMEQELNRKQIGFRKNDNAFLAVDDVAALQGAADRLTRR